MCTYCSLIYEYGRHYTTLQYLSAEARNPNPDEERTNVPYHQSYNIICATATAAAAAAAAAITVHCSQFTGLKASQQLHCISTIKQHGMACEHHLS